MGVVKDWTKVTRVPKGFLEIIPTSTETILEGEEELFRKARELLKKLGLTADPEVRFLFEGLGLLPKYPHEERPLPCDNCYDWISKIFDLLKKKSWPGAKNLMNQLLAKFESCKEKIPLVILHELNLANPEYCFRLARDVFFSSLSGKTVEMIIGEQLPRVKIECPLFSWIGILRTIFEKIKKENS